MKKIIILTMMIILLLINDVIAEQQVTQHGITWHFDKDYTTGQFANGDYWVLGPVTITHITPDFTGTANGWEVNPNVGPDHGFSAGCTSASHYDPSKVPTLSYTSKLPIESIVKTISSGQAQCVQTAAVLTVLNEVPENNGSTVFRPPYHGNNKPLYNISDIDFDLLPNYKPVGKPITLETARDRFALLRLEHLTSPGLRDIRPIDAMDNYNPSNQDENHEVLFRLMLNDTKEAKLPALINYLQHGIDKCQAIHDGWIIKSANGHDPGHRVIAAFTAILLGLDDVKQILMDTVDGFQEDYYITPGSETKNGKPLWGEPESELNYWKYLTGIPVSRSCRDPYGYIDGGICGWDYQVITVQGHKASALATHLMPSLKEAWNPSELNELVMYTDRWVNHGAWAQPDPCAPYDGNDDNYGITYGPDGMGGCIPDTDHSDGIGRFPEKHGIYKDGGQQKSQFIAAMWDAYRNVLESDPDTPSGLQLLKTE